MKVIKLSDIQAVSEEFLITMFVIVLPCCVLLVSALVKSNFWYSEVDVLREIKAQNPSATEIINIERNLVSDSVVRVATGQSWTDYCVDANIFYNNKIKECPKY